MTALMLAAPDHCFEAAAPDPAGCRSRGEDGYEICDGLFADADAEVLGELARLFDKMQPGWLLGPMMAELAAECRRRANEPRGHA